MNKQNHIIKTWFKSCKICGLNTSKADLIHKQVLVSIILNRVADYNENKLPPNLQSFVIEISGIKTNPGYNSI